MTIDTVRYLLQAVSGSLIDACAPAGERSGVHCRRYDADHRANPTI